MYSKIENPSSQSRHENLAAIFSGEMAAFTDMAQIGKKFEYSFMSIRLQYHVNTKRTNRYTF